MWRRTRTGRLTRTRTGGRQHASVAAGVPHAEGRATSVIAILFERGALVRKSDQVLVTPGSAVTLVVTSDMADDIHIHGYDRIAPTVPGGEARLEFAADRPGRYTAELESRALPLVEFIVESQ